MTMPHLMNCRHSCDGWCIACVKEQWEELDRVARERDRLAKLLQSIQPGLEVVERCSRYLKGLDFDPSELADFGLDIISKLKGDQ